MNIAYCGIAASYHYSYSYIYSLNMHYWHHSID